VLAEYGSTVMTYYYVSKFFLRLVSAADPLFVIMEYAKLGKLQSVLRNSRGVNYYTNTHGPSSLTSHELIMFCYQIAKGMDFLSSKGVRWTYAAYIPIILDILHYVYNAQTTALCSANDCVSRSVKCYSILLLWCFCNWYTKRSVRKRVGNP